MEVLSQGFVFGEERGIGVHQDGKISLAFKSRIAAATQKPARRLSKALHLEFGSLDRTLAELLPGDELEKSSGEIEPAVAAQTMPNGRPVRLRVRHLVIRRHDDGRCDAVIEVEGWGFAGDERGDEDAGVAGAKVNANGQADGFLFGHEQLSERATAGGQGSEDGVESVRERRL